MEPRPKDSNPNILRAAAKSVAADVVQWLGGKEPLDEVTEELTEILLKTSDYDGYNLANELERSYSYDPDEELVDIMGKIKWKIMTEHNTAIKNWIAGYKIKPNLEIGTKVKWKKKDGEVTGISLDRGTYTVFVESAGHVREGQGAHGYCVNWEDLDGGI
jgi:hypothetical protein